MLELFLTNRSSNYKVRPLAISKMYQNNAVKCSTTLYVFANVKIVKVLQILKVQNLAKLWKAVTRLRSDKTSGKGFQRARCPPQGVGRSTHGLSIGQGGEQGTSCRYRTTSLIRDLPMDTDFHLGTIHMSCMRLRRKGVVPKIRKFASMCQCNCLSQPHASNASRVNEPLGMDTDMRWKWYLKTPCAHQRDGI